MQLTAVFLLAGNPLSFMQSSPIEKLIISLMTTVSTLFGINSLLHLVNCVPLTSLVTYAHTN